MTENDQRDEVLTEAELAAEWRVTARTLARMRVNGEGPPHFVVRGLVRYRRRAVDAYEANAGQELVTSGGGT